MKTLTLKLNEPLLEEMVSLIYMHKDIQCQDQDDAKRLVLCILEPLLSGNEVRKTFAALLEAVNSGIPAKPNPVEPAQPALLFNIVPDVNGYKVGDKVRWIEAGTRSFKMLSGCIVEPQIGDQFYIASEPTGKHYRLCQNPALTRGFGPVPKQCFELFESKQVHWYCSCTECRHRGAQGETSLQRLTRTTKPIQTSSTNFGYCTDPLTLIGESNAPQIQTQRQTSPRSQKAAQTSP